MIRRNRCWSSAFVLVAILTRGVIAEGPEDTPSPARVRGALLAAKDVTDDRLRRLREDGFTSVVLLVEGNSEGDVESQCHAADLVVAAELDLHYWIEVARCPERSRCPSRMDGQLADAR